MGAEILIPLALSAASAGMTAYNTNKTAKREDRALADSIRNQSMKQRQADARTAAELQKMQGSTSRDEEAQRMNQYSEQIRRNRAGLKGGLGTVGGKDFAADAAAAGGLVESYAGETGNLMAQVDAPGMQRQNEAFGFGDLATDINLLQRESRGQAYIDELRRRTIKRNPWLDMAAGLTSAAAGSMAGGMGGGPASTGIGPMAGGYIYPTASGFPTKVTPYGVALPNYGG